MSTKKFNGLGQAWATLCVQHGQGKPEPAQHPDKLRLGAIKLWPEVFQHRKPAKHVSEAHVRELARGASAGTLDPLLVWWDGKGWACVDGHHRLKAYQAAGKASADVPVRVFSGSPEQAMAAAASSNTRDKLAMGRSEKTRTAWRLVVATELSKAETVQASGASDGTVAAMRRAKAVLEAQEVDYADMTWEEARLRSQGAAGKPDVDWEAETEQRAQEMAAKILRAVGKQAAAQVEAFGRALEIYDPRLPARLAEWWSENEGDEDEAPDEGTAPDSGEEAF